MLLPRGDEPSLTTLADSFGKSPIISDAAGAGTRSRDWWPCQLRLGVLRPFSPEQNPLGRNFDYAAAFATLDCKPPVRLGRTELTGYRQGPQGRHQKIAT